ncbi:hypothetical protein bas03_0084 [Escherichia phage JulesPiccard]|uniref:Uncharacterized protein n=1 Tax=Escherichia phage JulesPiccard TaxID=2851956 RepID=A0AAE8B787_9CAUD|nr:hypothetical protein bas03_0084 [Escherichia phage JulesPiccard]
MSNCNKHHYYYAYESKLEKSDIDGIRYGWADATAPCIFVGMKMAFYVCSKCHNILITERLSK